MKNYRGLHWLIPLAKRRFREVSGLDYLPKSGPFILAGNHVGSPDPVFIMALVYEHLRRRITFVSVDLVVNLVGKRIARKWLGLVEKIEDFPEQCLEELRDVLAAGEPVGIFPEGMRNSAPFLMPGRTGVARLAHWSGAPVIPFGFQGPATWTFNQGVVAFMSWRKDMILRIGKPLIFPKIADERLTKDLLVQTTREIMNSIGQLSGRPSPFTEKSNGMVKP